jgi:hypothetical protein
VQQGAEAPWAWLDQHAPPCEHAPPAAAAHGPSSRFALLAHHTQAYHQLLDMPRQRHERCQQA